MRSHFLRGAAGNHGGGSDYWPAFNVGVANIAYSNDNRTVEALTQAQRVITVGESHVTGKHYAEVRCDSAASEMMAGLADQQRDSQFPGQSAESFGSNNASNFNSLTGFAAVGTSGTGGGNLGTILGVAVDYDARLFWFSRNGIYRRAGGDPSTGVNPYGSGWTTNSPLFICARPYSVGEVLTIPDTFLYMPSGYSPA